MSVIDINGNDVEFIFDLHGHSLTKAYDIHGNEIFSGEEQETYDLPIYWESYLPSKVEEINSAVPNYTDAILFLTDYHINDYNYDTGNSEHSAEIVRYLLNNTPVSKVVFGGDVFTQMESANNAVNELQKFSTKFRDTGGDLFLVKGNHDDNNYGSGTLTDSQIVSSYFSAIGKNNTYYFVDDTAKKIRYIFIDTRQTSIDYSIANGNTEEKAYATAEVNWLISTLNSVPSGYSVIVFMHAIWWSAGSLSTGSLLPSESGGVQGVLNLYNSKSSGTVFDTISADFTSANGTALVCICGHTHLDYSHLIRGIVCFSSSSDSFAMANIRPDNRVHTVGTVTEHVLDVLLIDTENKKLKTIRIGSGQDREFNLSGANIGQKCSVTSNLTGCTSSNSATTAYGSYSATITADTGKTISEYSVSVYGFTVGSQYLTLSSDSKTLTINLPCVYGDVIVNCTAS